MSSSTSAKIDLNQVCFLHCIGSTCKRKTNSKHKHPEKYYLPTLLKPTTNKLSSKDIDTVTHLLSILNQADSISDASDEDKSKLKYFNALLVMDSEQCINTGDCNDKNDKDSNNNNNNNNNNKSSDRDNNNNSNYNHNNKRHIDELQYDSDIDVASDSSSNSNYSWCNSNSNSNYNSKCGSISMDTSSLSTARTKSVTPWMRQAAKLFKQAIRLDGNNILAYYRYGTLLDNEFHDYENAIKQYLKVDQLLANDGYKILMSDELISHMYYCLGRCCHCTNKKECLKYFGKMDWEFTSEIWIEHGIDYLDALTDQDDLKTMCWLLLQIKKASSYDEMNSNNRLKIQEHEIFLDKYINVAKVVSQLHDDARKTNINFNTFFGSNDIKCETLFTSMEANNVSVEEFIQWINKINKRRNVARVEKPENVGKNGRSGHRHTVGHKHKHEHKHQHQQHKQQDSDEYKEDEDDEDDEDDEEEEDDDITVVNMLEKEKQFIDGLKKYARILVEGLGVDKKQLIDNLDADISGTEDTGNKHSEIKISFDKCVKEWYESDSDDDINIPFTRVIGAMKQGHKFLIDFLRKQSGARLEQKTKEIQKLYFTLKTILSYLNCDGMGSNINNNSNHNKNGYDRCEHNHNKSNDNSNQSQDEKIHDIDDLYTNDNNKNSDNSNDNTTDKDNCNNNDNSNINRTRSNRNTEKQNGYHRIENKEDSSITIVTPKKSRKSKKRGRGCMDDDSESSVDSALKSSCNDNSNCNSNSFEGQMKNSNGAHRRIETFDELKKEYDRLKQDIPSYSNSLNHIDNFCMQDSSNNMNDQVGYLKYKETCQAIRQHYEKIYEWRDIHQEKILEHRRRIEVCKYDDG